MSTGTLVPEGIYLPPPGYQLVPDNQWEQLQVEVSGVGGVGSRHARIRFLLQVLTEHLLCPGPELELGIDPEYFVHHCIPSSQNRAWQLTDVY